MDLVELSSWVVVLWAIASLIVAQVYLLGTAVLVTLQTVTKRFYMAIVLCYIAKTLLLYFLPLDQVGESELLCNWMAAMYFVASFLEFLYIFAVAVTVMIAMVALNFSDSPLTPYHLPFRQYELWAHIILISGAAFYGFYCLGFVGEVKLENDASLCWIKSALARFFLIVVAYAQLFVAVAVVLLITLGVAMKLKRSKRPQLLQEKLEWPVGGCSFYARSFHIHLWKELSLITLVFLLESATILSSYLFTLLPIATSQTVLWVVFNLLGNVLPWMLLSFLVFSPSLWRLLGFKRTTYIVENEMSELGDENVSNSNVVE